MFIITSICIVVLIVLYLHGKKQAINNLPKDKQILFTVRLDNISLIENDSVGDDWKFEADINGIKVKQDESVQVLVNPTDKLNFNVKAEELDKIPDVGTNNTSKDVTQLNLSEKNLYSTEVTVKENKGRYIGNTAKWKFDWIISRKINLSDVVRNIF
ncbi:hypothetical protein [Clostridium sp. HMP27]|uniref:hypothetical protein n=1 Tax=Clostridium sp. HMP27 TaxID=1487921 RepID=UPI00052C0447|nr:hypothetical protein [Clostridium sp. HMP27]KGK88588.1 hypothetical protein DP68_06980 [Clostridium sp. HMP27]